jgi:hypothetical protein
MRRFGFIVLALGAGVYFYCVTQLGASDPVPPGLSIEQSVRYPAGQYQIGEYVGAMLGGVGLLLMLYPQGR